MNEVYLRTGSRLLNPGLDINLHTHSVYCDGKDEPEDMVKQAVSKGFRVLGFSGHGYAPYDTDCCMLPEQEKDYQKCLLSLREKYRGTIDLRIGIERDCYSPAPDFDYDYQIGSVHYIRKDGEYLSVDDTAEVAERGVKRLFGGSWRAYVEAFYDAEAEVLEYTGADIVGHFDLVTKFNEGGKYFDEEADWYRAAALNALRKIASTDVKPKRSIQDILGVGPRPVFEINMGGMAKGYRSRPYPADFLLEELGRLGCPVILSSDCHDRRKLDYNFREFLDEYL